MHLKVLVTNAFGLLSKFGAFQHQLKLVSGDVALVTETKFTAEKVSVPESSIPGSHPPIRLDCTAQGGGVAVWIKSDLAYEHLDTIPCQGHEVLWISLRLQSSKKLIICALYRPGSCLGPDLALLEYLDSTLDLARSYGEHIIIAGDFNVHNAAWLNSTKTTQAGMYAVLPSLRKISLWEYALVDLPLKEIMFSHHFFLSKGPYNCTFMTCLCGLGTTLSRTHSPNMGRWWETSGMVP